MQACADDWMGDGIAAEHTYWQCFSGDGVQLAISKQVQSLHFRAGQDLKNLPSLRQTMPPEPKLTDQIERLT